MRPNRADYQWGKDRRGSGEGARKPGMVVGRAANVAGKGGGPFGCRRGSDVPLNPVNAGGGKAKVRHTPEDAARTDRQQSLSDYLKATAQSPVGPADPLRKRAGIGHCPPLNVYFYGDGDLSEIGDRPSRSHRQARAGKDPIAYSCYSKTFFPSRAKKLTVVATGL